MTGNPINDVTPSSEDSEFDVPEFLAEEDWEAGIAGLLGGLPKVDPPEGFIDKAMDHRPLYAGRSALVASLVSVVAAVVIFGSGILGDDVVVPDLEALVDRHSFTEASLFDTVIPLGSTDEDGYVFELIEDDPVAADAPLRLPNGFELEASFKRRTLEQAVFTSGGDAVSVFQERGHVDFEHLVQEGLTKIDGVNAWTDPSRDLVIFQAAESTVTIIGLQPEMMGEVAATLDPEFDLSTWSKVGQRINRVTRELGFTDVSN